MSSTSESNADWKDLMRAFDFNILDVLDFPQDMGLVCLRDRPVVMLDRDVLGELRRMIIESLGWEQCKPIIFQFGYQAGRRDASVLGEMYTWNDTEQWLRAGPIVQSQRGQALCDLIQLSCPPHGNSLQILGRWYNSYEVDSHERLQLTGGGPVCYVLSGYISGFSTVCLGRQVLVLEQECAFPHKPFCTFEGRFLEDWGQMGFNVMNVYNRYDLREKFDKLKKHLAVYQKTGRNKTKDNTVGKAALPEWLCSRSSAMENVIDMARRVANTGATVLLTGETGVGKEIVARYIHHVYCGNTHPFLTINCTTLPDALLESELFGHVKGAFTGAYKDKKGLFEEAGKGTIFLDEIGDLPLSLQAKLLSVLEHRKTRPVGSTLETPVEARLMAGTNKDLNSLMEEKQFRADLYYRLNVFPIHVPPLRERRDEILPMARSFLNRYWPTCPGFSPEVATILKSYPWPGNVRELEHAIEHATILAGRKKIQPEHLPSALRDFRVPAYGNIVDEWPTLADLESRYIKEVMARCKGKKGESARILGVANNTLWRKLKRLEDSA